MQRPPDVLLLPSKLAVTARTVSNTVIINPGSLARGAGGGTFAEISIHPVERKVLEDAAAQGEDAATNFPVFQRTFAQIRKI
jgi:DNA polymerase alpha subunit B